MLVCDLPCDVCGDVEQVKFARMPIILDEAGNLDRVGKEIYCPEHNAGHADTVLLRQDDI